MVALTNIITPLKNLFASKSLIPIQEVYAKQGLQNASSVDKAYALFSLACRHIEIAAVRGLFLRCSDGSRKIMLYGGLEGEELRQAEESFLCRMEKAYENLRTRRTGSLLMLDYSG